MKKRLKGVGGLPRKLFTILMLSAMATLGWAADNSIYIDQAGDGATISMTQDGAGNRVRGIQATGNVGDDKPSIIKGDAIAVNIQQIGSGNVLNMGIDTTTANGGSPTDVRYKVTGNNAMYIGVPDYTFLGSNIVMQVLQPSGSSNITIPTGNWNMTGH